MHQVPNESMRRSYATSTITSECKPLIQDLLWISKQQQQHPLTHVHPLKNTIKINSRGQRCKFDGKQWRHLCESNDGFECRNLAFRSSLCQKHFYKVHLSKQFSMNSPSIPPLSLKRSLLTKYEQQLKEQKNDNSIESVENHHVKNLLILY